MRIFLKGVYFPFLLFTSFLDSYPKNPEVAYGGVSFERNGVIRQKTDTAIVNWESFTIHTDEIAKIIQPSSSACLLNRVTGSDSSFLNGKLDASGQVFLINSNGILIGPSGRIETGAFFASCLNIANAEFLANNRSFEGFSDQGVICNEGVIHTSNGPLVLMAREIENKGSLLSNDNVYLLAGEKILLQEQDGLVVQVKGQGWIDQSGFIQAASIELLTAGSNLAQLAIRHEGAMHAMGAKLERGKVILSAEKGIVEVAGEIQASGEEKGGLIQLLGGYLKMDRPCLLDVSHSLGGGDVEIGERESPFPTCAYFGPQSEIHADALDRGNGGTVSLLSNNALFFLGKASARGGLQGGDGGFIEVSSTKFIDPNGRVDTAAPSGNYGIFLIDPVDVTISTSATLNATIPAPPPDPVTVSFTANPANIQASALQAALNASGVIIDAATPALGGGGDITFDNGPGTYTISWSAPTGLTCIGRKITVESGITLESTGTGAFTAFNFQGDGNSGSLPGATSHGIELSGSTLRSNQGAISLTGRSSTTASTHGIALLNSASIISTGTAATTAATITLNGTSFATATGTGCQIQSSTITSVAGDIAITGFANGSGADAAGIFLVGPVMTISSIGTSSNAADIVLTGTTNSTVTSSTGISSLTAFVTLSTVDGSLTLNGTSQSAGTVVDGLDLQNCEISSTGSGPVIFNGTGSSNGTSSSRGILFRNSSLFLLNGDLTWTGVGGTVTAGSSLGGLISNSTLTSWGTADMQIDCRATGGAGVTNFGIGIGDPTGAGVITSNGSGDIAITGRGGSSASAFNVGTFFSQSSTISSTGTGDISITGIGGSGTVAAEGIAAPSGGPTITTITGDILITGTGGAGTVGLSFGIDFGLGSVIRSTGAGNITFNGTGGGVGASSDNFGVYLNGSCSVQVNGSGTFTGTGRATLGNSTGFNVDTTASITGLGTGLITVTGIPTGTGCGIQLNAVGTKIGNASTTNPILLIADSLCLTGTVQGTSSLTVEPVLGTTAINLGDSSPTGGLRLNATTLAQFVDGFSNIIFGKSASDGGAHTLTIDNGGALSFNDNVTFRGNTVSVLNPINAAANSVTIGFGQTTGSNYAQNVLITASSLNVNGGFFNDQFNINFVQPVTPTFLNGNGGMNTLAGPSVPATWNISSQDGGSFLGISFSNMQNLMGGSDTDRFVFADQIGIDGSLNGGDPPSLNFMDYSAFSRPANVIFLTPISGIASNLGAGFINFLQANILGNVIFGLSAFQTYATQIDLSLLIQDPYRDMTWTSLQCLLLAAWDPSVYNKLWRMVNRAEIIYAKENGLDLEGSLIKQRDNFRWVFPRSL